MAKNTKSPSPAPAQTPKKSRKTVFLEQVKKVFVDACVCYSLMVLLFNAIAVPLVSDTQGIEPTNFLYLFPFALIVGCVNRILFSKIKLWPKILLHTLIILGSFTLYLMTINHFNTNVIAKISIVVIALYVAVVATILIVLTLKEKKTRENQEYTNVYSNAEDDK